jgi:hypothetical protein
MTLLNRDSAQLVGIGFYDSSGDAEEADALVAALYKRVRPDVPEALRPALEKRPDSVGLYEVVHRN